MIKVLSLKRKPQRFAWRGRTLMLMNQFHAFHLLSELWAHKLNIQSSIKLSHFPDLGELHSPEVLGYGLAWCWLSFLQIPSHVKLFQTINSPQLGVGTVNSGLNTKQGTVSSRPDTWHSGHLRAREKEWWVSSLTLGPIVRNSTGKMNEASCC